MSPVTDDLGYLAFDADNHYYEALDAFTRHLDPKLGPRVRAVGRDRRAQVPRGRRPGQPRGRQPDVRPDRQGRRAARLLPRQPRRQEPARVPRASASRSGPSTATATPASPRMDEHGLEAVLAVPDARRCSTRSCSSTTPRRVTHHVHARSTAGSTRTGASPTRTASSPRPTSRSPTSTGPCSELEWALDRGARIDRACARPRRPPPTGRSPAGRPDVRPVLGARRTRPASPSSCTPATAATRRNGYADDGFAADVRAAAGRPSIKMLNIERADLRLPRHRSSFDKLFDRFPNLRIASVENGSEFLRDLFKQAARRRRARCPGYFAEDPVETFRRHVWINPFWEDDVDEVVELMGADRVIFGSDWPHIEGMPAAARLRRRAQGVRRRRPRAASCATTPSS